MCVCERVIRSNMFTFVDGFSKLSYGLAVCQVKFHADDIFAAWAFNDFLHSSLRFLHVSARYDYSGT